MSWVPWIERADASLRLDAECSESPRSQAKDALKHPYFDDLDKAKIDLLESKEIREREAEN